MGDAYAARLQRRAYNAESHLREARERIKLLRAAGQRVVRARSFKTEPLDVAISALMQALHEDQEDD